MEYSFNIKQYFQVEINDMIPSIFNDVVGPIMRGPSSSHSAGALRIGRLCRDLLNGTISKALIEYDPSGSLVTTHTSQGTDMGLYGGFLGWEPDEKKLPDYLQHIHDAGVDIKVSYVNYGATHPNTYRITVSNDINQHQIVALSTGGGMIHVEEIDNYKVSMDGDCYELLIYLNSPAPALFNRLQAEFDFIEVTTVNGLINVKSNKPYQEQFLVEVTENNSVKDTRILNPVLPVLKQKKLNLPFTNVAEMEVFAKEKNLQLCDLAIEYEKARSGLTKEELWDKMTHISKIMQQAIHTGLSGTEYEDRLLPSQSPSFKQKLVNNGLIEANALNQIIMQVSATMESKSSMQTIVASPTAGSCGALPGAVFGCVTAMGNCQDETIEALFAAGMIGVFIASGATFAAEEAGCMAECGSASSMAAAALVHLAGGDLQQSLGAASMALQNSFGMVCDPIANRVEAPCLGKNVMAATNALSCANMALSNYLHLIPFDEVVVAMDAVGKAIPHELCCTALGGLSVTPTAKTLEGSLETRKFKISC
jgi:L-serine dehydratase